MQTTAIRTVANSLPENEVILLTLLISKRYIPYTDLQKYIVLPTVYSFFFILFPIVGFILFRSVDEICLFVDSICCSCYASLTLMSVRRTADDE